MTQENNRASALLVQHRIVVLLIDDQKIIGEAVRRMLKDETDIDFHFCMDPKLALNEAEQLRPTLILQDLIMPEVDGLDLVVQFRNAAITRNVPLIVLSSKEEPAVKAEAFARGANDYLVKLPDRIELLARMRYHSNAYIAQLQRDEAYNALFTELGEAASYVRSQLAPPLTGGTIRSAWEFVPSTALGGDSFGYFDIDSEHFAFFLLDVCGHGVGSALLSVSAMSALNGQTLDNVDFKNPGAVLAALNSVYAMEKHNLLYFTIWYGVFNRSNRSLLYASAGHPPALVVTEAAAPIELRQQSLPIGMMDDIEFSVTHFEMPPNATVFLFSDGLYEVTRSDGIEFRFNAFVEKVASITASNGGLHEIVASMRATQGKDEFEDDVSIVELKFD